MSKTREERRRKAAQRRETVFASVALFGTIFLAVGLPNWLDMIIK